MKIERFEPNSNGCYSKAVRINDQFLNLSGMVGNDKSQDLATQTRETLANINAALEKYGSDKNHVITATVYLKNVEDFEIMNQEWATFFNGENLPTRTTVQAAMVHPDYLIEVTVSAVVR